MEDAPGARHRTEEGKDRTVIDIPPNITALYQAALLIALWFVLKRLIFDRLLGNLDRRDERTRGALEEARRLRDEAATLRSEYESSMAEVRREATRIREEIRREAENEERGLIEEARRHAGQTLEEIRTQTDRELQQARKALEAQTEEISSRIVRNVLGRA